jgi:hypothetical protein
VCQSGEVKIEIFCLGCYKGQAAIIISEVACLEFDSTIYRKYRDKELSEKALMTVLEKFESDRVQRYEVVHVASFICYNLYDFLMFNQF